MKDDVNIWLERISALHRSLMRKAVAEENLQFVHYEILQYLSICNHYSNTAQALTEYLGQTKGSMSQSLKILGVTGFIERKPDPVDKRYARLFLTDKAINCLERMNKTMIPRLDSGDRHADMLKQLLIQWQRSNDSKGFGLCRTCRYNQSTEQNGFLCGLTGEKLKKADTERICREHDFPDQV